MNKNKQEKFFVNENICINCGICTSLAPQFFNVHETKEFGLKAFVQKEPSSDEEITFYNEIKQLCPTGAIQS